MAASNHFANIPELPVAVSQAPVPSVIILVVVV
jgi:hypothetical protein